MCKFQREISCTERLQSISALTKALFGDVQFLQEYLFHQEVSHILQRFCHTGTMAHWPQYMRESWQSQDELSYSHPCGFPAVLGELLFPVFSGTGAGQRVKEAIRGSYRERGEEEYGSRVGRQGSEVLGFTSRARRRVNDWFIHVTVLEERMDQDTLKSECLASSSPHLVSWAVCFK